MNPLAQIMNRASLELRPLSALLELTYKCNLLCSFCYNAPKQRTELDGDQWIAALDKLRAAGTFNITLSGGECLAHRDFWRIAQAVRDRGFVLKVYTNGVLLADRERARRLAELAPFETEISMHGADAATHERLTGVRGSFDKMIEAFGHLSEFGVKVIVKTPITRLNQHQLASIEDIAARFGHRVTFDTNITPTDDGDLSPLSLAASPDFIRDFLVTQIEKGRRAGISPRPIEKMGANCNTGRTTLTIDPYGDIFPCVAWRRKIANIAEVDDLLGLWQGRQGANASLDYVRQVATDVPRRTLIGHAEGAFASFCPGVAEKETGDPFNFYQASRISGLTKLQAYEQTRAAQPAPAPTPKPLACDAESA